MALPRSGGALLILSFEYYLCHDVSTILPQVINFFERERSFESLNKLNNTQTHTCACVSWLSENVYMQVMEISIDLVINTPLAMIMIVMMIMRLPSCGGSCSSWVVWWWLVACKWVILIHAHWHTHTHTAHNWLSCLPPSKTMAIDAQSYYYYYYCHNIIVLYMK